MDKINTCLDQSKTLFQELSQSYAIKKKWKTLVGKVLAKSLWFQYIKGEHCFIEVTNPCWFSEITLYEKKIIENINTALSRKKKITKLKIMMKKETKEKKREYALRKNYDTMIGR